MNSPVPPNVLLYISHDTGRFIGPYGHATVSTPVLDEFAEQSVLFERAFATCPLCCPSRASIVTSLYPHETGVNGLTTEITGRFDLTVAHRHVAALLRRAGYETAVCGPIHEAQNIWDLGFGKSLGGSGTGQNYGGDMREFADEIREWLAGRGDDAPPFYLQIGSHETHRDWTRPDVEPDSSRGVWLPPGVVDTAETRAEMAAMQGATSRMDRCLGEILGVLRDTGHERDTLVILTTDHGIDMPDNKGTLTDRGLGVFLLVRFPASAGAGVRIAEMVSSLDITPTILDVTGVSAGAPMRGRSLAPFTTGHRPDPAAAVFAQKTYHDLYDPTRTVRTASHRYIRYFDVSVLRDIRLGSYRHSYMFAADLHRRTHEELFDLTEDPNELVDRSGDPDYAEVKASLKRTLAESMAQTRDPLLDGPITSPLALQTSAEFRALAGRE